MPTTRPVAHARTRERRLPFGAPVRAWAQAEWVLLPLRIFLGATFLYAGLQKLANPNFFNAQSPSSIQAQMIASVRISPVSFALTHLVQYAKPIGLVIALAEVAVGTGTLLGLWTRVAAAGGALLSLTLFLTVSFHASPYFTGADIVFFFAWLPLILAGGGSRTTVDAWIARRAAKMERAPAPTLVAIPFVEVQRLCGHFKAGRCSAREGRPCEAAACPVLLGPREPLTARGIDAVDRRSLVLGGAAVATAVGVVGVAAAATAGIGRALGGAKAPVAPTQLGSPTTTTPTGPTTTGVPGNSPTTTAPASATGTLLGSAHDVPVGNAATFTVPSSGDPGIVVQPTSGQFFAYDAVCPHAGCTVGYYAANHVIACPCHGSTFAVDTGQVLSGPSPRGLTKLDVVEESNGNLYLK